MDKIYSRTRIKFDKSTKNKARKIIKIFAMMTISILLANAIIKKADPIMSGQCVAMARSVIIKISNEEVSKVMQDYSYDDLLKIIKDQEGNIKLIETNVNVINKIISEIPNNIQKELDKEENNTFAIKLGNLTGTKTLSGRGPDIIIKLLNTNNLDVDLQSEFVEQGINQTLHRIYLKIRCVTIVSTPYKIFEGEVNTKVLLTERVIIGEIPSTYYNLKGISMDNVIDVVE